MGLTVSLSVNGNAVSREVEERTLLVELLRDHLRLTGTHVMAEKIWKHLETTFPGLSRRCITGWALGVFGGMLFLIFTLGPNILFLAMIGWLIAVVGIIMVMIEGVKPGINDVKRFWRSLRGEDD